MMGEVPIENMAQISSNSRFKIMLAREETALARYTLAHETKRKYI